MIEQDDQAPQRDSFEAGWKDRFARFAEDNDDDAGIAGWSPTGLATRLRMFTGLWQRYGRLRSGNSQGDPLWLDIGCGAGTYSRFLAEQDVVVLGMDYSLPTLEKVGQRQWDDLSVAPVWAAADVTRLPLKKDSVDGLLCFGVIQALSDSDPAARELARVTRPGGQVWVDGLNNGCLPHLFEMAKRKLKGLPPHLRYESPYALRRALQRHGMGQVRVRWLLMLPGRWARYQPWLEQGWVQFLFHAIPPLGLLLAHSFLLIGEKPR